MPGDYDGSGHLEVAVYDPTAGTFEYHPANGKADVVVSFGSANGQSVPVAAPPGSLPASSGSGRSVVVAPQPGASGTRSGSADAIATSRATGVPAGPRPAQARVARALINQAVAKPGP